MDSSSSSKKRARSSSEDVSDANTTSQPLHKKQLPIDALGASTSIKKSAAVSPDAFRSPLRNVEPSTISIQKARDILAYAQLGDPRSFKLAVKETFSFLALSARNQEYIQTYLALIYVGKTASHYFHLPLSSEQEPSAELWHFLVEQLSSSVADLKRASELAVLACNLLYHAFQDKNEWPIDFVQAFLEDSFGKRLWVDDESARGFVCGVLSVTPKDRANESYLAEDDSKSSQSSTQYAFGSPFLTNNTNRIGFKERYADISVRDRVSNYVSQLVEFHLMTLNSQEQLFPSSNASASDGLKSLIRTLSHLMPFAHIRPVAARYLDAWFSNPQTARLAKELFRRMTINTVDVSATDLDIVRLVLRYKTLPSNNPQLFFEMVSTLASHQPIFRTKLLQDIVSDLLVQEISSQSIGAKTLGRLFESSFGTDNEASLASVIHELALDTKFGPQLKVLVPMLLNHHPQSPSQSSSSSSSQSNSNPSSSSTSSSSSSFKQPPSTLALCNALFIPYYDLSNMISQIEPSVAIHWCHHITDTIMSLLIYSVPKILYEQTSSGSIILPSIYSQREEAMRSYHQNAVQIQSGAVEWCQHTLPSYLGSASSQVLPSLLRRILFIDPLSSSYFLGNVTLTSDQLNALAQTLYSSPISESMVMSLLLCAQASLAPEGDILDILEHLLIRTLRMPNGRELLPDMTNPIFLSHLFGLCALKIPIEQLELSTGEIVEIGESSDYRWAVRQRAWKVCGLLTLCAASKPSTTGALAWANVPMVKILLEIILTRAWIVSSGSDQRIRQLYVDHEAMEARLLPFLEAKLQSSASGANLDVFLFDPFSTVCKPPKSLLAWIRELEVEFKLSRQLFKNRNPDFVSDLLKRDQMKAARWLSPLIASDQSFIPSLPSKCLSILLIASQATHPSPQIPSIPPPRLTNTILKSLEIETTSSVASACTVWQYLFNFLSSESSHIRIATHRALLKLLCDTEANNPSDSNESLQSPLDWLQFVHRITHYKAITDIIEEALVDAIKIEVDADIMARILAHLKSSRESSNNGSLTFSDLIFLCNIIHGLITSSSTQQDAFLRHKGLLELAADVLLTILQSTSLSSSNPSQSMARWYRDASGTVSELPVAVFGSCLTILAKQAVFFNSFNFRNSKLHHLAQLFSLVSQASVEYPIGAQPMHPMALFESLDPTLNARLIRISPASTYFTDSKPNNSSTASTMLQQKVSDLDFLTLCGISSESDDPVPLHSASSMDIDPEKPETILGDFIEASLVLFSSDSTTPSSLALDLQTARTYCTENTSIDEISNLNQAAIRAFQQTPHDPKMLAEMELWHQLLLQLLEKAKNAAYDSVKGSSVPSEGRMTRLSQEISILQPFVPCDSSHPIISPETSTQSMVNRFPKDLAQMASFIPNTCDTTHFIPMEAEHACIALIEFIQQRMAVSCSGYEIQSTVRWLVQISAICDFSPLIDFVFVRQSDSKDIFKLKSLFVEIIHNEGSWKAKQKLIDWILGTSDSSSSSVESAGLRHFSSTLEDRPKKVMAEMPPIESLEVSLCLKFLTLHLDHSAGKSWSDHISSISNKVAMPLKDRPASLVNFSKSQLLRLFALIMRDLTDESLQMVPTVDGEKNVHSRAAQWASFLLACCNHNGSKRDETKVLWLIESLSQTPNAHIMNIMRWMDDMTQASLAGGSSLNFRPEQLVYRFESNHQPSNKMNLDDNHHHGPNISDVSTKNKLTMTVDEACESILTHLYFDSPWQVFSVVKHFTNRVSATNEHSKLDYMIHRLLKRLLQDGPHQSELLMLRTFALSHPAFIIKFLPTMSALLNGRTQAGPEEFLRQKSDEIFENLLGILEMLIPLIFHDNMAKRYLPELLEEYFKLLQSMCEGTMTKRSGRAISLTPQEGNQNPERKWLQNERIVRLIGYFSNFLAAYCAESLIFAEAADFISSHLDILISVSESLPSIQTLQKVVQSIQTQRPVTELDPVLSLSETQSVRDFLSQYSDLSKMFNVSNKEEILTQIQLTLHDLEQKISDKSTSTPQYDRHKVSVLNYLISHILPMTQWSSTGLGKPNPQSAQGDPSIISPFVSHAIDRIRKSSLSLSVIYLQTFPREGERVIDAFLSSFRSSYIEIRQDALPYAKIVCLSCVSHSQQVDLMMSLFSMGKVGQNPLRDILAVLSNIM